MDYIDRVSTADAAPSRAHQALACGDQQASSQIVDPSPDRTSSVNRLGLSWPLLVGAVVFLALSSASALLHDADTYWHLAAGKWILEHGAIPTLDPFSHTMQGSPWTAHEWLSEVVLALAYATGGWSGVVMSAALAFAAAMAVLTRYLLRHLPPIYALMFVALAGGVAADHLLARPHVLALPLIVSWTAALLRARECERAPSLSLALLMVVWANLHGSFPLGIGLAGALAIEALLKAKEAPARWRVARKWGGFLSAALVASLVTPHGFGGWTFVTQVQGLEFALSAITEWRSPNFQRLQLFEFVLLLSAAALMTRGLKLPLVRLILVLGLLHLSLKHARHIELLGLLGPLIVAQPLAQQWRPSIERKGDLVTLDRLFAALAAPARPTTVIATALVIASLSAATAHFRTMVPFDEITPARAITAAREAGVSGPVLNSYEFGGYLIYIGIPPFVDGRADLYGDKFLQAYVNAIDLVEAEALVAMLKQHRIEWTLLSPHAPAVSLLDHLPDWRRLYGDDRSVVHVRRRKE